MNIVLSCKTLKLTKHSGKLFSIQRLFSCLQLGFFLVLGGFTFFNVQKTKYLQLFTTFFRWLGKALQVLWKQSLN